MDEETKKLDFETSEDRVEVSWFEKRGEQEIEDDVCFVVDHRNEQILLSVTQSSADYDYIMLAMDYRTFARIVEAMQYVNPFRPF